ncbi:YveK family protein [Bacillus marinisedimentorum]|uniref:YveK family protein n=1 Tax=Bacillus marinisedimentorum TaxID=1821260 RepID=UPI0007E19E74|nr:Wzz/FepE/Etk N-terminal domain-containing protein [Bacillus marinisedimentorum]
MEETISLKEIFETLKKRFSIILVITLVAVLVSGIVSYFFLTPVYQNSTQILVNKSSQDQNMYNVTDVRTNLELINTYNVIIKSPAILDKVAGDLDSGLTYDELNSKVTVQSENQSQVVTISAEDPDPQLAAAIANTTAQVFQKEIAEIMNVDNVSILAEATVQENQSPVKPNPLLNIAIAMVVGLMAGVGLAFLLEYLDNTLKTEQDIEKALGLPVLGVITKIDLEKEQGLRSQRSTAKKIGSESIETR